MALIETFLWGKKRTEMQEHHSPELSAEMQATLATAKQEVISYTNINQRETTSPDKRFIIVRKDEIRELLLRAGYVSIAMGPWKGFDTNIHAWGKESRDYLKFHHRNEWIRVDLLERFFNQHGPDLDVRSLQLRQMALQQLEAVKNLKLRLTQDHKRVLVGDWRYDGRHNELLFMVIPEDQSLVRTGWYPLERIRELLDR